MKSFQLFFLFFLLIFIIGCGPDLCEDVECGIGDCVEGFCDCPIGFSGINCEIEECFGVGCINGDCDPQTETCNCDSYYFGESCNMLCINGEFLNGDCNCSNGYEGVACETESRCRFLGWWGCDQWTSTSQIVGSTASGILPASIKIEKGINIYEVELFPTESSNGLMLLSSDNRIIGQVTENTINFEFQHLTTQRTVYGSASFNNDNRNLSIELYFSNPNALITEVAKGTFRIARFWKD